MDGEDVNGSSLRGRLLVASPTLDDPNFSRTVLLVLEHTDGGALAVVLNRPSETEVADPLPGWARLAATPPVVFVGGPVAPSAAICLARAHLEPGAEAPAPLPGRLGTVDLDADPDDAAPGIEQIRVFAGYSAWAPGQLEAEIAVDSWFVVEALPEDAMSSSPDHLWQAVLRRQGGSMALFAAYPPDPSLN